jgi:hypothetical protein
MSTAGALVPGLVVSAVASLEASSFSVRVAVSAPVRVVPVHVCEPWRVVLPPRKIFVEEIDVFKCTLVLDTFIFIYFFDKYF